MKNLSLKSFVLFFIAVGQVSILNAQSWSSLTNMEPYSGTGGETGHFNSMVIVHGYPAIAHYDQSHVRLLYRRALDSNGTTWGDPVAIAEEWSVGEYVSMEMVNGHPAVVYFDRTHGDLLYKRALDSIGQEWASPILLENVTNSIYGEWCSLAMVNGNPAVAYYHNDDQDLKYIRASDPNGTNWSSPLTLDSPGIVGQHPSLAVVSGNPAIAYHDFTNKDLKFIRALDVDGNSWSSPQIVEATNNTGYMPSLEVINGNPAIAYWYGTGLDLRYVRAADATGASWNSSITLETSGNVGQFPSLTVVNGFPAISFRNSSISMKYIRANDADGVTWGPSYTVDGGDMTHCSMIIVNGRPAIAYGDESNWVAKFKRANNIDGTSWPGIGSTFEVGGDLGWYMSMTLLEGKPAASYYDRDQNNVRFVRALDTGGTQWGTPVNVNSPVSWGGALYGLGQFTSIEIVNGKPAISFLDQEFGFLKYVQALDSLGNNWGTPIELDGPNSVGEFSSLAVVNGNPAVAFNRDNWGLRYTRALDPDGTTWSPPIHIYGVDCNDGHKLQIVNGNPAIVFWNEITDSLCYVRANDPNGTSWSAPVMIDMLVGINNWLDFEIVNGNPAIAYRNSGGLYYIRSNDSNGTSWGTSNYLDNQFDAGQSCDLSVINGIPAIAYHNASNEGLYFIEALDSNGLSWQPIQNVVVEPDIMAGLFSIELIQLENGLAGLGFLYNTKSLPMFTSYGCQPMNLNVNQVNTELTSLEIGATYQWINCDSSYIPLTGYTSSTMSAPTTGNYAVEISINGCVDTSQCVPVVNADFYNSPGYTSLYGEVFALPTTVVDSCDAVGYGFAFGGVAPYSFDWYTQANANSLATSDSLCHGMHELMILDNIGDSTFVDYYIADSSNYYNWYSSGSVQDTLYLADQNCSFNFSLPLDSISITNLYYVSPFNGTHDFHHIEISYYQGTNSFIFQDTVLMNPLLTNLIDFTVYCPTKSNESITKYLFVDDYSAPVSISELDLNHVLNIYPNPSNGIFQISMSGEISNSAILKIYNASMSNAAEYYLLEVLQNGFIDARNLAPGIYFIQVSDSNFSWVHKIVIQ